MSLVTVTTVSGRKRHYVNPGDSDGPLLWAPTVCHRPDVVVLGAVVNVVNAERVTRGLRVVLDLDELPWCKKCIAAVHIGVGHE